MSDCSFCAGRGCLACHGSGSTAAYSGPQYDGDTFDPLRDGKRLTGALECVRAILSDGRWHTIGELAAEAGCSEAAASARLRDLRKARFGGYTIAREYVSDGLWHYRMVA